VAEVGADAFDAARIREALGLLQHRIALIPWFAAAGEPLEDAERDEAGRYLAAVGLADVGVAAAGTWQRAKAIADDPAWDRRWWDAEERLRIALRSAGWRRFDGAGLEQALSRITAASDLVHGAAAVACARAGVADAALIKSAAGAATQACYLAALATAAGAGAEHAFAVKFRLFAGGRWPLGIIAGAFYLL
jgi:hypothetical protein